MTLDLSTTYLGLRLRTPLVAAPSPLTGSLSALERLADAGAGAVVLPSLFEEQIEREEAQALGAVTDDAEPSYVPELENYNTGPTGCLTHIELAKQALSIPVIASLNGATQGDWVRHARLIEQAGADALELNIYITPTDAQIPSARVEQRCLDLVAAVREQVSIPLAVKIGSHFSSIPHMAARLVEAGADGLVLFNRYLDPDIDLQTLEAAPRLTLSSREELRLPLRWIGVLRGQTSASLAATSGIHTWDDALKAILVGADVAMLASALLRFGPDHLTGMLREIEEWMKEHDYASVDQFKGLVHWQGPDNFEAHERALYIKTIASYGAE